MNVPELSQDNKFTNMNIAIIMGAPYSGKGTVCKRIAKIPGVLHISTGDLLRKEISLNSEIGKVAASYELRGEYVPDEMIFKLLTDELLKYVEDKELLVLLDGYPRTKAQALDLNNFCNEHHISIVSVAILVCREEILFQRMKKRAEEQKRKDDTEENFSTRIKEFLSKTVETYDVYRLCLSPGSFACHTIDAESTVEDTVQGVLNCFPIEFLSRALANMLEK
jgi:adenylate kinase